MLHYTFNTGHVRNSPRSEVGDDTIEFMARFVEPGEFALPDMFPGWRIKTTIDGLALISTLFFEKAPTLTIGVALDTYSADMSWPLLESLYHNITELPNNRSADFSASKRPEPTPWCAVVLIDALAAEPWMGDFERCLAWAWIEKNR